ncbi:DUF2512 family protein [Cohnella kolymensis]|nr:DUF2512 family protein [Cohnella kolymensis]
MKFVLKWLINGVIVSSLLVFYTDIDYITAAFIASVLSVIEYFIGDQLLLRATNNTVATIADGVGALLFLGVVADSMNLELSFGESLVIAAILAISEWIIHRYIFKPINLMVEPGTT